MLTKLFVNAKLALENYKNDDRGVTAIEYGLIAAGVAVVVGAAFLGEDSISTRLSNIFDSVKDALVAGTPKA
ncbi:Flp family type IVb pilin [Vibrio europaeus]|uniref:Flp family type IVb pilin n=1 Tax=Vibrio europaeus TaxID=300876 RepID=A0AAE7ASB4_9VIBR|nr:Flp family type IVb pilin [Vibrio europaeus]MDC5803362.1 Flp family type IVb pilin [Vibrio europaeus]MDC5823234.1 Flp family type IVb pilin [Vibrio europaeus]MDC5828927.1 Flp family type IVb pilin [Vibrio europaeus]MDC5832968.1 Flp family type IVb pilin [Vibrio europaeus]QJY35878.1 Flp family type IVb pilin [Vibrio europaeus]